MNTVLSATPLKRLAAEFSFRFREGEQHCSPELADKTADNEKDGCDGRCDDEDAASCSARYLYDIGEISPLGHVPAQMHAWAIRKDRHGPPETAMQLEVLPTWPIGENEVLVLVMAGGVNYNGVWAGLGIPISPLDVHKNPFHIAGAGSDASGIVWACGPKVRRCPAIAVGRK